MSRCIRSCAPLSFGHPTRPRMWRIPSDTHQADKRVRPTRPLVAANGGPLSDWMASGIPFAALDTRRRGVPIMSDTTDGRRCGGPACRRGGSTWRRQEEQVA